MNLPVERAGAVLERDPQRDSGLFAGGDHGIGVAHVQRHRFLDENMLPGAGCTDGLFGVLTARRADRDRVDLRVRQDIVVTAAGHTILCADFRESFRAIVGHREQFSAEIGVLFDRGLMVIGDDAGAENREAQCGG